MTEIPTLFNLMDYARFAEVELSWPEEVRIAYVDWLNNHYHSGEAHAKAAARFRRSKVYQEMEAKAAEK